MSELEASLTQALEAHPQDWSLRILVAEKMLERAALGDAAELVNAAPCPPETEAHLHRLVELGGFGSIPLIEAYLRANPASGYGHTLLADLLLQKGDLEKAEQHRTVALALNSANAPVLTGPEADATVHSGEVGPTEETATESSELSIPPIAPPPPDLVRETAGDGEDSWTAKPNSGKPRGAKATAILVAIGVHLLIAIIATIVVIAAAPSSMVRADLATIYFKDGKTTTIELEGVDRARLLWKQSSSASEVNSTLRSEVDSVTFPTTETWRKAEDARESGRLEEALKLYREVIADPVSNYFPFPGNFVSLAKERMLQCYRLQLDASKVAAQAKIVREEFFHLPPELKRVEPETAAWTAIADENWEGAITALETVEAPTAETYFLKARALEGLGKSDEAVTEYAGAYVLNFGGSILLTREALRRSSQLVFELGDPEKTAELQAQVKLYRDLYGKGISGKERRNNSRPSPMERSRRSEKLRVR